MGVTDFTILKKKGILTRARKKNPPIVDSANAVNAKLMTAAGDISMYFHPRVVGTIKSMERTQWLDRNPDSMTIDKTEGVEHYSDGVRYATEFLFPIIQSKVKAVRGFNF